MKMKLILLKLSFFWKMLWNKVSRSCFDTVLSQSADLNLENFAHPVSFRWGIHSFFSQLFTLYAKCKAMCINEQQNTRELRGKNGNSNGEAG